MGQMKKWAVPRQQIRVWTATLTRMTLLLAWAAASSAPAAETDVSELLSRWRDDISAPSASFSSSLGFSPHWRELCNMGPRVLPELSADYAIAQDITTIAAYGILFGRASWAEIYQYSDCDFTRGYGNYYDGDAVDRPFLSQRIGPAVTPAEEFLNARKLFGLWWQKHEEFLERPDAINTIRGVTGTTSDDFASYGWDMHRRLARSILVYGVYNVPAYLDVISEDNNPVIAYYLLKNTQHPQYISLVADGEFTERPALVQEHWATREAKLKLICEWWEAKKHTFTRLKDLHTAIDTCIQKIEAELDCAGDASAGAAPGDALASDDK